MLLPGCVSCDIVTGKRIEPGGVIYENDDWHIGTAIGSPVIWRGFLIIKLKRHCEHLAELTHREATTLGPLIQATCSVLTEILRSGKVVVCSFGDGGQARAFLGAAATIHHAPGNALGHLQP